jgi:hypothetical protein
VIKQAIEEALGCKVDIKTDTGLCAKAFRGRLHEPVAEVPYPDIIHTPAFLSGKCVF